MARSYYEVVPDEGDRFLSFVARDVGEWREHRDELESLETSAESWSLAADRSASGIVWHAFEFPEEEGIEKSLLKLTTEQTVDGTNAIRALALAHAVHKIKQMGMGTGYDGVVSYPRAMLTVNEPGVIVTERKLTLGYSVPTKVREALPGERFVGSGLYLHSSPERGGTLRMTPKKRSQLEVTGLVNVETVKPRVQLDLLHKLRG